MGKGFQNYMCKKFFHPGSLKNLERVWMAKQQAEAYKKKQEELRILHEKEQDFYNNKALLSKESKDKLSLNFMYEPPPGAKKERENKDCRSALDKESKDKLSLNFMYEPSPEAKKERENKDCRSALDAQQHLRVPEHEYLMVFENEEQSELSFLKSLSKKEKRKLLSKLQLLEKKNCKKIKRKLKKKKK